MKEQISNKNDANRAYENIYPVLQDLLDKGYSFDSDEMQGVVGILAELPAWGARRENFKKQYLKDEYGLRKLPSDPALIPSGMWH
ncbi:hypothetical protein [Vibrio parahaemolyticus]|uniref:hypothetical protein n=1 Tax=Vibrio parahaemolyticus TaxID=670 RepID=UPI00387B97E6